MNRHRRQTRATGTKPKRCETSGGSWIWMDSDLNVSEVKEMRLKKGGRDHTKIAHMTRCLNFLSRPMGNQ